MRKDWFTITIHNQDEDKKDDFYCMSFELVHFALGGLGVKVTTQISGCAYVKNKPSQMHGYYNIEDFIALGETLKSLKANTELEAF